MNAWFREVLHVPGESWRGSLRRFIPGDCSDGRGISGFLPSSVIRAGELACVVALHPGVGKVMPRQVNHEERERS